MIPQLEIKKISKELNELSKAIRLWKILRKRPENRPEKYKDMVMNPWPEGYVRPNSLRATLLCCIRAHHHGKLHMHKTLEDQEAFINGAYGTGFGTWDEFVHDEKDKPENPYMPTTPAKSSPVSAPKEDVIPTKGTSSSFLKKLVSVFS